MSSHGSTADANTLIGHDLNATLSNIIDVLQLLDVTSAPPEGKIIDEAYALAGLRWLCVAPVMH